VCSTTPCPRMLTRQRSPPDPTLSVTGQDRTGTLKNNRMAFFVSVACFKADLQPARTNRNPIALTASAANASGSVQTTLSKLPRPHDLCVPAFLLRGSPDRDLTFVGTNSENPANFCIARHPAGTGAGSAIRCEYLIMPRFHLTAEGAQAYTVPSEFRGRNFGHFKERTSTST
jgi:hypothetical protein